MKALVGGNNKGSNCCSIYLFFKMPTTMYLWVKYTTASRVYIHLVAKAVRIESAMG